MGRVLIIDDAVTVRMFHRQLVEQSGHQVVEAENGVEGLEKLTQGTFDLMLVDINMPRMDGYRFVQSVRENPETAGIPAIMISTEAEDSDRDRAYACGANLYIIKPCDPERLNRLLVTLIGHPASRIDNDNETETASSQDQGAL